MILDEMCRNESSFFTYSIVSTIFTVCCITRGCIDICTSPIQVYIIFPFVPDYSSACHFGCPKTGHDCRKIVPWSWISNVAHALFMASTLHYLHCLNCILLCLVVHCPMHCHFRLVYLIKYNTFSVLWFLKLPILFLSDKPDTRRISFTSSLLGGEASGLLQHENSTENAGMASASNDGNQSRLSWDDLTGIDRLLFSSYLFLIEV